MEMVIPNGMENHLTNFSVRQKQSEIWRAGRILNQAKEETLEDENLNDLLEDANLDANDGHQGSGKTPG